MQKVEYDLQNFTTKGEVMLSTSDFIQAVIQGKNP